MSSFLRESSKVRARRVDLILSQPATRNDRLRIGVHCQINDLWAINDFRFIRQRLHAQVGTFRQHLALMIAGHPDISRLPAGPVVLIHKIKLKS